MGIPAGMKLPEAYHRAASRYQQLMPAIVGVIGTLWGMHLGFQRVHAEPVSLALLVSLRDAFEALGVAMLAGCVVFAALLLIELSE